MYVCIVYKYVRVYIMNHISIYMFGDWKSDSLFKIYIFENNLKTMKICMINVNIYISDMTHKLNLFIFILIKFKRV